jgi:hypothetical protein
MPFRAQPRSGIILVSENGGASSAQFLRLGGGLELSLPLGPARSHNVMGQPTQSPALQKFVDPLPPAAPRAAAG